MHILARTTFWLVRPMAIALTVLLQGYSSSSRSEQPSPAAPPIEYAAPGSIDIGAATPCLARLGAAKEPTRVYRVAPFTVQPPPRPPVQAGSCAAFVVQVDGVGAPVSVRQIGTGFAEPSLAAYAEAITRATHFQARGEFGIAIVIQPRGDDMPAVAMVDETGVVARWPVMRATTDSERTEYFDKCKHDLDAALADSGEIRNQLPAVKSSLPIFYLPQLKRLGIEGCVVLEARIEPDGAVGYARVVSQYPADGGLGAGAVAGTLSTVSESPGKAAATKHWVVNFKLGP